jgi:hypothetical protein
MYVTHLISRQGGGANRTAALSRYLFISASWSLLAIQAQADVTVLSATDAGFVTEVGGSAKGDGTVFAPATNNYSAGREEHYAAGYLFSGLAPMDRKNYFVFDLSSAPGPILAAELKVYAGPDIPPPFPDGTHGYESFDPVEAYDILPTMDPPGALADAGALKFANTVGSSEFDESSDPMIGVAMALYGKLAAPGMPLGSKLMSPADDGEIVSIFFTPAGVGYLNSFLGSSVIFGGKVSTAPPPAFPQSVFGSTGPDIAGGDPLTPKLVLTFVPEISATWMMVMVALLAFGWRLSRRLSVHPSV